MPASGSRKVNPVPKREQGRRLSRDEVEPLIKEATVDAYGESEQVMGLFTMLEDHLVLPFETKVLGVNVTVEKLDLNERDDIVAVCRRGSERQTISILDLRLPEPPPDGWQWVEAYRHWARGWR